MSQKKGLLSSFLDEVSEENSYEQLKQLETEINIELVIMEQKYRFEDAVAKIKKIYERLDGQIYSVSGKALVLILDLHFEMHNTLTRMIKKKTITDLRKVRRSSGALPNREDARVPHPFISETSGESSGESKFDDNVYMLNTIKKLERLPADVLCLIRKFAGFDGLPTSMQKAAELDLNILKQINFLITNIVTMLRPGKDNNIIRYYNSMAKVSKELIAKFSILGLDTSPFEGTTILVPRRLRF
jgi:hypothetical protein